MTTFEQVHCNNCGHLISAAETLPRTPCISCGSTARKFEVKVSEDVEVKTSLGMKAKRDGATGKRKWHLETFNGWSLHHESGEMRKVQRTIDRENDRYLETVEDKQGNLIRQCDEPLKQHQGRGDAKRKR